MLLRLVSASECLQWGRIAMSMPSRNARQCRDRYNNYINPQLKSGNWTKEEDELLEELLTVHGQRWAAIARFFGDRSVNSLRYRHFELVRLRAIGATPVRKERQEPERRRAVVEPVEAKRSSLFDILTHDVGYYVGASRCA